MSFARAESKIATVNSLFTILYVTRVMLVLDTQSEFFRLVPSAEATTKSVFLSIFRVVNLKRTLCWTRARISFVIKFAMAGITEMGSAETEPKRNFAAVATFKVDKLSSVRLAVGYTCAN